MEEELWIGLMDHDILEILEMIKLMDMEFFIILMEINTKENGYKTKQMVKEYILMQLVLGIKVAGQMIYNMDMAMKHGKMEQLMQVNIKQDKNTEKENLYLQMVLYMKVFLKIMKLMNKEYTNGLTVKYTKENG